VLASSAPPLPPEGSYVSFGPIQLMKPPEYVPCLYRGAPFEFLARRAQHEDEPEPLYWRRVTTLGGRSHFFEALSLPLLRSVLPLVILSDEGGRGIKCLSHA
jgi:hypothetical protein